MVIRISFHPDSVSPWRLSQRVASSRTAWFVCGVVTMLFVVLQPSFVSAQPNNTNDDRPAPKPAAQREREFRQQILPLMETHCFDCHSDAAAEGDFSIESFDTASKILDHRNMWLKVLQRVVHAEMPPEDASSMTDGERDEFVTWMDDHLNNIDCGNVDHPGTVTIRRLTRFEYRNTVRDLIGVDYATADDFPADDVGYGFDNIGDVLSLPPLLMEKYLNAAEDISEMAIVANAYVEPQPIYVSGAELKHEDNARPTSDGALAMSSNGTATTEINLPHNGRYEIIVTAYGEQAGRETAEMAVSIDNDHVRDVNVRATERSPAKYTSRTYVRAGKRVLQFTFTNDYYDPDNPRREQRDRNLIIQRIEINGPLDFEPRDLPESHEELIYVRPDDETSFEEASEELLTRLASRAYRRPATDEEIERLQSLVKLALDHGDSFEAGMQLAVQAVLVSPKFLFKVEGPPENNALEKDLTVYELGVSLSYFLWSSMPDDDLLLAAWDGDLLDDRKLEQQVLRMIDDPKSTAFVENFSTQWLQLRALEQFSPDPDLFPTFDDQLRDDMMQETVLFFGEVVRNDRSVVELFDADYSYLNESLARHYGVQGVRGDRFQRIEFDDPSRGGLLTHASILTVTSNPSRTSPVKRGKWIIENLLGEPPPPPAPDVMALDDQEELTGTLRERMQQHREDPSCASCHAKMDPLGFALENYNAVGQWRDLDEGSPIDASGVLPNGDSFEGAAELRRVLTSSNREQLMRCFAEKLLTYALGRGLEYYDQCAIDEIVEQAGRQDYKMSAFLVAVVQSEPFQRRRLKQQ